MVGRNYTLNEHDIELEFDQYGPRHRLNGFWRGVVEQNYDPLQMGRIKVRIFQLHGDTDTLIQTNDLPWANACFPPGGGSDYGTFIIPPKGSTVWVGFEQGDPQHPVWFGSWKTNASAAKELFKPETPMPPEVATGGAISEQPQPDSGIVDDGTLATRVANAIKQIESDGRYNLKGLSGESGAYQFMPKEWNDWSTLWAKENGKAGPVEMTPANQDAVARWQIQKLLDQGYTPEQIASIWNCGKPDPTGIVGVNKYGVAYDAPGYVRKFKKAFAVQDTAKNGKVFRDQSMNNTTWVAPVGNEIPRESQAMANHEPTISTWNKSPKGHTIAVEDRDGVEHLKVTDRAGNVILMSCPVTEDANTANKAQRGVRSVTTGDALDRLTQMRDKGSKIVVQDQAQSMVELDSRYGDEKVTVVANNGEGGIETGKNRQRIELMAGANRVVMESVHEGKVLARITMDSNTGVVTIEGDVVIDLMAPLVNLTAEHINLNGNVNVDGDITVSGRITGGLQ